MIEIGVKYIIYSCDDGSIKKERLKYFTPKVISVGRLYINRGYSFVTDDIIRQQKPEQQKPEPQHHQHHHHHQNNHQKYLTYKNNLCKIQ